MIAVDALATYRLARLVSADVLTFRWRERWIEDAYRRSVDADRRAMAREVVDEGSTWRDVAVIDEERAPKLAYLVACPWCASIWIGAGVVLARRLAPRLWDPVARTLAASAVAGLLSGHES